MGHVPVKVKKAVFPVAGLGTRFLPATKVLPKEMLVLGDKPLIQHAYEEARAAGIEEFVFVSSREKSLIEKHFRPHRLLHQTLAARHKTAELGRLQDSTADDGRLSVIYQDQPLGLGHAVWCARKLIGDEPFAVILPDDVVIGGSCLAQMIEAYGEVGGNLVAIENVPRAETCKYGVLDVARDGARLVEVRGLVEKPDPAEAPSTLAIIGRYILQPQIFGRLAVAGKGAGGEIQLTDSLAALIGAQPFHGFRFEGRRYDCGSSAGLLKAHIAYAINDNGGAAGPLVEFLRDALGSANAAAAGT
ncbi:MAG: UTP--glucose-1-phosphate uridylyltransferase [Alphaproteobacteria bacterium]|nr:UTP--glucose-1-phosphate uridylyltransferase [Alphaproteobacteria bacterium]